MSMSTEDARHMVYSVRCKPQIPTPDCSKNILTLALHSQNRRTPQGKKKNPWLRSWLGAPTHKENKKKLKTKIKKLNEINKRHCHILINSSQGRGLAANLKHTGSTALKARLV